MSSTLLVPKGAHISYSPSDSTTTASNGITNSVTYTLGSPIIFSPTNLKLYTLEDILQSLNLMDSFRALSPEEKDLPIKDVISLCKMRNTKLGKILYK